LEQLLIDQQEAELGGLLEEISNSTYSTQSTIPSLPSLSGSQYLTASSTTSRRTGTKGLKSTNADLSPSSAAPPNVSTTPYPGHVKGAGPAGLGLGLSGAMAQAVAGKQRQKRGRGTKRSDPFNDSKSDSNIPTETSSRHRTSGGDAHRKTAEDACYCDKGSGHFSDSAVSAQQQLQHQHRQQLQEESDLTAQSRRKHGRVRPQGADIKRKRARQLEKSKPYYNSKIETVLEEEVPSEEQRKPSAAKDKNFKQKEQLVTATKDETKPQPVIADVLPSNPPSPALSRMVRQKTESLNISETTLQQIKEMNSHLRIVNWLWDSTQLPLGGGGRKARSCRGTSPGAATTVTTNSDNLVVVRKGAGANWFDLPRVNHQEAAVCRQEQMSPVSANSDFKSDYEDELMSLV
jgi:hypothetical protein